MVIDFKLISKLRATPKYQVSSDIHSHKVGTNFPQKLPLYLAGLNLFYIPLLVVRNFQPL